MQRVHPVPGRSAPPAARTAAARCGAAAAFLSLSLSLGLAACGAAPDAADAGAVRVAAPDLTIGATDGDPAYLFGGISGVTTDSAGRIYVVDAQADEVRVFSDAGAFLFTIGRRGSGPGELSGPCCPAFGPDGRLWIRDGGNARYNAYAVGDTAAEYVTGIRIQHGDANRWAPLTFDSRGNLIDIGSTSGSEPIDFSLVRFHVNSAGTVVARDVVPGRSDSLAVHVVLRTVGGRPTVGYIWQPYGTKHRVAYAPGGAWAEALTSHYTVWWYDANGVLLRIIRRDVEGPALSAEERQAAEEDLRESARRFGVRPGDLPFDVPERKGPIGWLYFDAAGRLWVERSVADGEPRRADVYGRTGAQVATVEWPADVDLRSGYIGDGVMLGVARDTLGVQRVVRLRWEAAS
ncbi:MAG TPA: 6-bladed beta-propeller [Longimicrobiales bacterium]